MQQEGFCLYRSVPVLPLFSVCGVPLAVPRAVGFSCSRCWRLAASLLSALGRGEEDREGMFGEVGADCSVSER